MDTRGFKQLWLLLLLLAVTIQTGITPAMGAYVSPPQLVPGVDYNLPNYANSPPLTKFKDTLPGLTAAGANSNSQYIPVGVPMGANTPAGVPRDGDYYEIALVDYIGQFHSELQPTKLRGYVQIYPPGTTPGAGAVALTYPNGSPILYNGSQVYGYDKPRYLGPTIVANRGVPTRVKFYNLLSTMANGGTLFVPTDVTVMGAGMGPDGTTYPENRATLHLHGGDNPWISDGTAHQWITPAGEAGTLLKGASQQNVPDMPLPASGAATFYWPNGLSGRLMFYHDHAMGTTRLDVYAGEAAGYLLVDPSERTINSLVTAEIPLVIQDKTFVNDGTLPAGFPAGAAAPQKTTTVDPLWAANPAWGQTNGSLWLPHVYVPNQNPNDLSGANPMGRWDYGAWFWPVFPSGIPPQTSTVPESFMDTPIVNGTAYPSLNVNPSAYRFRVLNAANDRYWNLQLYVASPIISGATVTNGGSGYGYPPLVTITPAAGDTTGHGATAEAVIDTTVGSPTFGQVTGINVTTVGSSYTLPPTITITPAFGDLGTGATATATLYTNPTEVGMIPAVKSAPVAWPSWWTADDTPGMTPNILDGRAGGVPDPFRMGPAFINIGSEAGVAPAPVILNNTPIGYEQNKRSVTVLNTMEHTLFLGPAERADVIIDFSQFAGKTLILYNDSPAPVPAGDPRYDYYTGDPDNTSQGGAPTTVAGFGPNTRTIMQINVAATTPAAPINLATLTTALASVFAATQPAPIVPANTYARISDTSMTINGTPNPLLPKTIQELFDPLGRMNATLGVEIPFTTALIQTTIPYGFADPATEVFADGSTQLWKITHNGVDTHAIHFHLFDVQVVNRVGWDGAIKPPHPEEIGWKDTVKMNPLEDIVVALHAKTPTVPFKLPNNVRPLDPTQPLGATTGFLGLDPNNNPVTVTNQMANFGAEYTWHCHLLGHEENDMMRPTMVAIAPEAATLSAALTGTGANKRAVLTWIDNSLTATSFSVDRATDSAFTTNLITTPLGKVTTFTDTIGNTTQPYYYRVTAINTVGSGVAGFPSASANSAFSNTAGVNIPTIPAAPSNMVATLQAGPQIRLTWTDNSNNETTFLIQRAVNGGAFATLTSVGTNVVTFTDTTVVGGNSYQYKVAAVNVTGTSAFATSNTVAVPLAAPAAPTGLTATMQAGPKVLLNWTSTATVTGFTVQRATNSTFTAGLTTFTVTGTATTYTDTAVTWGTQYFYRVAAVNGAQTSGWSNVANLTIQISFVRVAAATPLTPTQTVTVAYPGTQTAGNLNIVVVGWNNTTSTVSSVTDNKGNVYTLAIGPTSGTAGRQAIYYAPAKGGASTSVTVTFNTATPYPDVRILEYSGVGTLDKVAGASGSSTTANSGSVTTTAARELVFGAGYTLTAFTGAGTGFTSRIITTPDADIAEDRFTTATGTYSATAPNSPSGAWVMQVATFK